MQNRKEKHIYRRFHFKCVLNSAPSDIYRTLLSPHPPPLPPLPSTFKLAYFHEKCNNITVIALTRQLTLQPLLHVGISHTSTQMHGQSWSNALRIGNRKELPSYSAIKEMLSYIWTALCILCVGVAWLQCTPVFSVWLKWVLYGQTSCA
jgi:hypothetical protein